MPNIEGRPAQPIQPVLQKFDAGLPGGGGQGNDLQQNKGVFQLPLLSSENKSFAGERVRVPVDIEARLAEMDAMWGTPIALGKTIDKAVNIMDDRLNLLHQEVLEIGDQNSIRTIGVVNLVFKQYHFNWLSHEKRVAFYQNLKEWHETGSHTGEYLITVREQKIVSECSERMGNGQWEQYNAASPTDSYIPIPTLEDLYGWDAPDPGEPAQPSGQQFYTELPRSERRSAQLTMQAGERESEQLFQGNDRAQLAQKIRAALQQETSRLGQVNPIMWLRFKTKNVLKEAIGTRAPKEKQLFFRDVYNAYSILAYEHIPEGERPSVAMDLANWTSHLEGGSVTIENPKAIELVETMAEATDIPYTPGQTTFELPNEAKLF